MSSPRTQYKENQPGWLHGIGLINILVNALGCLSYKWISRTWSKRTRVLLCTGSTNTRRKVFIILYDAGFLYWKLKIITIASRITYTVRSVKSLMVCRLLISRIRRSFRIFLLGGSYWESSSFVNSCSTSLASSREQIFVNHGQYKKSISALKTSIFMGCQSPCDASATRAVSMHFTKVYTNVNCQVTMPLL